MVVQREKQFETFLSGEPTINSDKAVASRMVKARKAETILGKSLDTVVANDDEMYDSLVALRSHENYTHSPMQNAVRKYYKFINGKEFPQLRYYKR